MSLLRKLTLNNYRNHDSVTMVFGDGLNLIVGGNAKGKTNILESIYFLSKGRSFRTQEMDDIVMWGAERCSVEGEFVSSSGSSIAQALIEGGEKVLAVDGKKKRSAGVGVVLFIPEDITIFRGSPTDRRGFLDELISGVDGIYLKNLREYQRLLSHRNAILKEGQLCGWANVEGQLAVWTERLIDSGERLIKKRLEWIGEINKLVGKTYFFMGGYGRELSLRYFINTLSGREYQGEDIKAALEFAMNEKEELDRIRGSTNAGPHRDDWTLFVNERDIRSFGSQGQMRMGVIALKMVEIELHKSVLGEVPVLLLDDVISELDGPCADKLLQFVNNLDGQVFITSTDPDLAEKKCGGLLLNGKCVNVARF